MKKQTSVNQVLDSWQIIENNFDVDQPEIAASIFSQANEFIGTRGNLEEGFSGNSLNGSFYNGIFESVKNDYTVWQKKGAPDTGYFIANGIKWIGLKPSVDGECLDMAESNISSYKRRLDMKTGLLSREFIWHTKSAKSLKMLFERFVSMGNHTMAAVRLTVTAENCDCKLELDVSLDALDTRSLLSRKNCIEETGRFVDLEKGMAVLTEETINTKESISCAMNIVCNNSIQWTDKSKEQKDIVILNGNLELKKGQPVTVTKYIGCSSTALMEKSKCQEAAQTSVAQAADIGFDKLFSGHCVCWDKYWEQNDIVIKGDEAAQQGIRFCLFQLQMTKNGLSNKFNIAPKGLTGEMYVGATWWDTETYNYPFYVFTNPKAAKDLLEYRYNQFSRYRKRAKIMKREGAQLPFVTTNGDEMCSIWDLSMFEVHINCALAFAIWLWDKVYEDDFINNQGAEMLVESARYCVSRTDFSWKLNKYVVNTVVGPDEYRPMSNNNAYTNGMFKFTISFTYETIQKLKTDFPERYKELEAQIDIKAAEIEKWKDVADNMYVPPLDDDLGVIPQDDLFMNSSLCLAYNIPQEEIPISGHWSYDMLLEKSVLKQPDTILAYLLLGDIFSDRETMARTYRFYEPRTIHDSSLSPCIHSILASEFGLKNQAYNYYLRSARLDLDDYNKTSMGLHMSSLSGAWMSVIMGFGGMRWHKDNISLSPYLPGHWDGYSFNVKLDKSLLKVEVSSDTTSIYNKTESDVTINLYGENILIKAGQKFDIPLKEPEYPNKNRGALFDLDGVLVHTDKFHYEAWKELADEEKIYFDEKINNRLRGVSRKQSLEIILEKSNEAYTAQEKERMLERKNIYFCELINKLTPSDLMPGTRELLTGLKETGWQTALCSSSKNAKTICEKLGIASLFDGFIDGTMIEHTKPHPEIFLKACKSLKLFPGDCVVFEDAQVGIDAAKTIGTAAVGICGSGQELSGADVNVEEIAKIKINDLSQI